ncbi:MAG TPA: hypothetical protein VEJ00_02705 [Candidatus Acidoferrales bacterium]|nr:hypothetical protein [Candidatus Acidoferrales bacterium]
MSKPHKEHRATPKQKGLDVGWYLAAVMAVGLSLAAPKIGQAATACGLVLMAAFLVHPIWTLSLVQRGRKRWLNFSSAMLVAACVLTTFGFWVWPPIRRHILSEKERAWFDKALKETGSGDLEIQMACPPNDEQDCAYANQFISLIGRAGWNVNASVERIPLTRPPIGVTVYRRGGNRDYSLKHWDAGGYFNINEPHLLAIQSAFRAIRIEIDGATDPDVGEAVMMIYVGPEREDESQPTALTPATDWATGKRKGPFPFAQQ